MVRLAGETGGRLGNRGGHLGTCRKAQATWAVTGALGYDSGSGAVAKALGA